MRGYSLGHHCRPRSILPRPVQEKTHMIYCESHKRIQLPHCSVILFSTIWKCFHGAVYKQFLLTDSSPFVSFPLIVTDGRRQ